MRKLLLFSASSYKDTGYLVHVRDYLNDFLIETKTNNENILFIPFAGVRRTYDEYEGKVKASLNKNNVVSIHKYKDFKAAILDAKVFLVGGGNSFMLLSKLYEYDLIDVFRKKIMNGTPYIGWSAGSNIAGASIKTTNDMPIVMPKSFDSLGVFDYQINPHFISGKIQGHNGESREERLQEFLLVNKEQIIYALPEGSALKVIDNSIYVLGYDDILKISYPFEIKKLNVNNNYCLKG